MKECVIQQWGSQIRLVVYRPPHGEHRTKVRWKDVECFNGTNHEFTGFPVQTQQEICYPENWTIEIQKGLADNGRFDNNIARAKTRVRELALCNDWQYFATLTLCEEKQNRFDLPSFIRNLGVWIGNFNKRYSTHLEYLIIPEQHKNGAWHAHGLFRNVPEAALSKNEHGYLDMPYYRRRFGYISLSPVRNQVATARYITKYITKDLNHTALERGWRSFYHSRGLAERREIARYTVSDTFPSAWESAYCGITWGDYDGDNERLAHWEHEIRAGRNPFINGFEYESKVERANTVIALAQWRMWRAVNILRKGESVAHGSKSLGRTTVHGASTGGNDAVKCARCTYQRGLRRPHRGCPADDRRRRQTPCLELQRGENGKATESETLRAPKTSTSEYSGKDIRIRTSARPPQTPHQTSSIQGYQESGTLF